MAARDTLPVPTRSICPHCGISLDAELIDRGGRVILRRECPEHGPIEALAYGDTARWLDAQRYERPGASPLLRQTAIDRGCPSDCGICPAHAQHTCLGIIEVNTGCNLDCPVCFAESGTGHQPDGYSLTLAPRHDRARAPGGVGELAGGVPTDAAVSVVELPRRLRGRGVIAHIGALRRIPSRRRRARSTLAARP